MRWKVPIELSPSESRVAGRLKRSGRFYAFLREIRHELFDSEFQAELEEAYGRTRGTEPLAPAMLAMVTLLQAYGKVSDAEAVETAAMDKRWQLVLGCLGAEEAPFSQGVLPKFRQRMVEHDLDRKLLDRTVAIARRTGQFGWQHLKAALDSSPLLGAGRVEDTFNLIGRALSAVVDCAAKSLSTPRERVLQEAGLTLLTGPSIKAALDIDWDDPAQRAQALHRLLEEVKRLEAWVALNAGRSVEEPPLKEALELLRRVVQQDLEPDPVGGGQRIKRGVARDRIPSVGDPEMRHGRKSRKKPFNGYKRHIVKAVDADLILGATVLPANQPEQHAVDVLLEDVKRHGKLTDVLLDRGYLASPRLPVLRDQGVGIHCKPWPSHNAGRFTKEQFTIDLAAAKVTCPTRISADIPATGSGVVHFPSTTCNACRLQSQCTTSRHGRSLTIHPSEELLLELRERRRAPEGRHALRERVTIEHSLAKLVQVQGPRARYKGIRRNTLDVRRCAAVVNLQTMHARLRDAA